MKRRLLLFLCLLSLAANAALAWQIWSARRTSPAVVPPAVPAANPSPPPPVRPLGQTIESDDPAAFVQHLREAGFPSAIVNAIVESRLRRKFDESMSGVMGMASDEYWTTTRTATPDQARTWFAARAEFELQLQQLLGPGHNHNPRKIAEALRRYGPINPAKIPALEAIDNDYQSMLVSYRVTPFRFPGDEEAIALLETERQADLAALLSPSELFEYNLRNGDTAQRLRSDLAVMQVSEQEFRQLYPLWADYAAAHPVPRVNDPRIPSDPAAIAAREALVAQAALQIGAARAEELAQALIPQAFAENMFAARIGLPASAAREFYQANRDAQALFAEIEKKISAPGGKAALAEEAAAILARVNAAIGEENAALYESSFGGPLKPLRDLAQPATAPEATTTSPPGG